mgnify:CR=1 FL=1
MLHAGLLLRCRFASSRCPITYCWRISLKAGTKSFFLDIWPWHLMYPSSDLPKAISAEPFLFHCLICPPHEVRSRIPMLSSSWHRQWPNIQRLCLDFCVRWHRLYSSHPNQGLQIRSLGCRMAPSHYCDKKLEPTSWWWPATEYRAVIW